MKLDRRSLLKWLGAAPVAAAVPPALAAGSSPSAVTVYTGYEDLSSPVVEAARGDANAAWAEMVAVSMRKHRGAVVANVIEGNAFLKHLKSKGQIIS